MRAARLLAALALLAGALALLAVPASAQQADPAPVASVTTSCAWVLTLGAKGEVGREEARHEVAGAREALASTATVKLTAVPFRYSTRLELTDGQPSRYTLESNVHTLDVQVDGSEVTISGSAAGTPFTVTTEAPGPAVVLDNLVCSHYDRVAALALGATGEVKFSAIVPQIARVVPATLAIGRATRVVGPGGERVARVSTVTIGNVAVTLVHDQEAAVAYRVLVPGQDLEGVREGWSEVRPAGPSAQERGPAGLGPAGLGPATESALPELPPAREVEVRFDAPLGSAPATLTLPATGEGPWPCVVLLHGSGPHDRDETIGPNKPFRDLAHQLAGRGVASLRYPKRTWLLVQVLRDPASTPEQRRDANLALRGMTLVGEAIEDGVAALRFLATRPEVRRDALFVLGHSLGGVAAPEVARVHGEKDGGGRVRGLVLVATPGRPLLELMHEQVAYQGTLLGAKPEEAAKEASKTLEPLRDGARHLADEGSFMGASGRYWRDVLARDPSAALAASPLPALLVQGGKDCQVSVLDHERLVAAAGARGTARLFPAINHLLMPIAGERSTGAEYALPGRVEGAVAGAIAAWILDLCSRAE